MNFPFPVKWTDFAAGLAAWRNFCALEFKLWREKSKLYYLGRDFFWFFRAIGGRQGHERPPRLLIPYPGAIFQSVLKIIFFSCYTVDR